MFDKSNGKQPISDETRPHTCCSCNTACVKNSSISKVFFLLLKLLFLLLLLSSRVASSFIKVCLTDAIMFVCCRSMDHFGLQDQEIVLTQDQEVLTGPDIGTRTFAANILFPPVRIATGRNHSGR
jgi:hypothetical protein